MEFAIFLEGQRARRTFSGGIPPGLNAWLQNPRNFRIFPNSFWSFSGFFWAPQGPGTGPKCAPESQLSNPEVSSESGHWRPDWWRKYVLKKSQEPCIFGARYSNPGVESRRKKRGSGEKDTKLRQAETSAPGRPKSASGLQFSESPRKTIRGAQILVQFRALGTPFVAVLRI